MVAIHTLKKGDLQALASEFGVETDGTKADIETRISDFLTLNRDAYVTDPRFSNFFHGSPSKARRSTKHSPEKDSKDESRAVADTTENGDASEDASEETEAKVLHNAEDEDEDEEAEEPQTSPLTTLANYGSELTTSVANLVADTSNAIRDAMSSVDTVNAGAVALELTLLLNVLLPRNLSVAVPYTDKVVRHVPDLWVLLSVPLFWGPLLTWFVLTVATPLVVAYYFNFAQAHSSKRRRRAQAGVLQHLVDHDPLSFAVARFVAAYLLLHVSGPSLRDLTSLLWPECACLKPVHAASAEIHRAVPLVAHALGLTPYFATVIGAVVAVYVKI